MCITNKIMSRNKMLDIFWWIWLHIYWSSTIYDNVYVSLYVHNSTETTSSIHAHDEWRNDSMLREVEHKHA